MPRNLGNESWDDFCERVASRSEAFSWRWAAVRQGESEWELLALVAEAAPARDSNLRIDRYAGAIVAVEKLSAATAAARLLALHASTEGDECVPIPEQLNAVPQLVYGSESWGLTPAGWPRLVVDVGAGAAVQVDPSQPLLAADMPFYLSLGEALAERVFRLPPELVRFGQYAPVSVRINDRRGRIAGIEVSDATVLVSVEEGMPGGLDGFTLHAVWRSELALEERSRSVHEMEGPGAISPPTDRLPAELTAVLVGPEGAEVDRRTFDRHLHASVVNAEAPEEAVTRMSEEGEHVALEYKRELDQPKVRRSFAETVAAFANGSGGTILVGIDDDGSVVGWGVEKPGDQITTMLADLIEEMPDLNIEEVRVDNKPITVVQVTPSPPHRRPHLVGGRAMVRVNATTRTATAAQHRELASGVQ